VTAELRAQAGQLLVIGFEGTELTPELRRLLRQVRPGGVILFTRNIVDARQTWRLLRDIRRMAEQPPFLAVDMEGGTVDRLKSIFGVVPAPAAVAAAGRADLAALHGLLIGRACRALGFNTDFAPVLDLARPASRKVMGTRPAGENAKEVVAYARPFLAGLKAAGVVGCGKHFPGLGHGALDSHHALPVVMKNLRQLRDDLEPYLVLRTTLPLVMVSHLAFPAVTGERVPASLSEKWITGILRRKVGYRGLVTTDDMEMGAALSAGPMAELAPQAIAAGADLVLVCRHKKLVLEAWEGLLRRAEREPRFAARVKQATGRILRFKRRAQELQSFPAAPTAQSVAMLKSHMKEFTELIVRANQSAGDVKA
jgi:beta-N-acetylhexosaminidase